MEAFLGHIFMTVEPISREAPVRFGSVTVWGWNGSSGSGFRFSGGSSAKRVSLCFTRV